MLFVLSNASVGASAGRGVFIALSGGDVEQACDLACNHRYVSLLLIIANGATAASEILKQREMWHTTRAKQNIPITLSRI